MGSRLALQALLELTLESENVYFQPPPTIQMVYPCIVYRLSDIRTEFANNSVYKLKKRYDVTVIDRNPDSAIPERVVVLPLTSFDRHFPVDNLNHNVFTMFF